jgi:hypothetical protein
VVNYNSHIFNQQQNKQIHHTLVIKFQLKYKTNYLQIINKSDNFLSFSLFHDNDTKIFKFQNTSY